MILLFFMLVGILAGLIAGLFGVSGGIVVVPALFLIFRSYDFPSPLLMHLAIGTSLASMVFNSLSATFFHHRKKAVLWQIVIKMIPGLIAGSIGGAFIASLLPGHFLKIIFGVFLLAVSLFLFFKKEKEPSANYTSPGQLVLNGIGIFISAIANILGIGGSIFTTPILMAYKISIHSAIGTASAIGFLITFMGAFSYLIFGLRKVEMKETIGYLYIPAFFIITLSSSLIAPLGVKWAHYLNTKKLTIAFAIALLGISLFMILG